ncbi:hypothetical protein SAMN04488688_102144 [Paenibacillus sp. cl141a]|uniref:hypothetical protein n=1 Tax=Paenibacillus sp. cl141a TaxID=1761877 RepID=UPI0008C60738|nr:hypothetical protein [Paenibacillus sp. cl141a]SEK74287.1 hypothetical protein SAMN04488688_102144 [Paenibacillus sp. cl141a]
MATAYIINQESRVVVVIPDVEKIEGNTVCGKNASASGIDLNQTKIIVIETSLDIKRGDTFPDEYEDISEQFRKLSKDDQIDEMNTTIGALLLENANHRAMLTSLEDNVGGLYYLK